MASSLTQIAADSFTQADGPLSGNWTTVLGADAPTVVSNAVRAIAIGTSYGVYWNANSFPVNQYSQITLKTLAGTSIMGCTVRMSTAAWDGYLFYYNASTSQVVLGRYDGGGLSTLTSASYTASAGDVMRLETRGPSFQAYVNGVAMLGAQDATYTLGFPGIQIRTNGAATDTEIDDWSAGSVDNINGSRSLPGGRALLGADMNGTYFPSLYPFTYGPRGFLRSPQEQWQSDATFRVEAYSDVPEINARQRRALQRLINH